MIIINGSLGPIIFPIPPSFATGCTFDPPEDPEKPDWKLDTVQSVMSVQVTNGEIDLEPTFLGVSNQLQYPSCTANAGADHWEQITVNDLLKQGMPLDEAKAQVPDYSRLWIWWQSRNMMWPNKTQDIESGSFLRLVFNVIARFGVPPETLWPYSSNPRQQPSIKAQRAAFANICKAFYKITGSVSEKHDQILKCLQDGRSVAMASCLEKAYGSYTGGVFPWHKSASKPMNHAQVIAGWSESMQAYKIRNSWSASWGLNGYAWVQKECVTEDSHALWAGFRGIPQ